ncbi:MAG: acyclic terpene utilization AtuA family protein [Isosphaerales bacterium]
MVSNAPDPVSGSLRVGNGAGFWGDNLDAPYLLARDGRIDVLTLEYLAELTMAILSHLRSKDATAGYVTDFPELVERLAPVLIQKDGLRVVTNAGGLNPPSCAARCGEILKNAGLRDIAIGVVTGDDVLGLIPAWTQDGIDLAHLETGAPISGVISRLVAANVYLGARPIALALQSGCRFVVTGRVADASLTLGPAAAHFGWRWDDWTKLAGASVAGHLIECGAQATGGLWHEWNELSDPAGIGYPIAELAADGSCVLTKPEGTGGRVSVGTVTEQLLYEIDDPARYRTPDVDVDFTSVSLAEQGMDRVLVQGATGQPPSDRLKLVAVYRDGWTASGMLAVVGRAAEAKARAAGALILERVRRAGVQLADSLVECLGAGDVAPGVIRPAAPPFEVVLRVTVRDPERAAVERFCRELAPLVTSGPPGIAGYATGRPSPRPAFGYWPALVPRALAEPRTQVDVRTAAEWAGSIQDPPRS